MRIYVTVQTNMHTEWPLTLHSRAAISLIKLPHTADPLHHTNC